mmetsp:Transcript_22081/g.55002  ORF Transcript_22081/g.55002 Transcript_22081/m.55002 type:complete len:83 (-) Transcript_22081:90-338(-)
MPVVTCFCLLHCPSFTQFLFQIIFLIALASSLMVEESVVTFSQLSNQWPRQFNTAGQQSNKAKQRSGLVTMETSRTRDSGML